MVIFGPLFYVSFHFWKCTLCLIEIQIVLDGGRFVVDGGRFFGVVPAEVTNLYLLYCFSLNICFYSQKQTNADELCHLITTFFRLDRLNGMSASEEISDEDARQMIFELETAYDSFNRFLEMH